MKRTLKGIALMSSVLVFGAVDAASAAMTTIYGPVYISKTKEKHEKETKLTFRAPVPGKGVLVVKNGGDSGRHARVGSAEVELNGRDIARKRDFNKNVETLEYEVELLPENKLEVKVRSCKDCEIALSVLGEEPPPVRALPTR